MERIFSYGTLQKDKVQRELFGRLLKGQKDRLPGYKTLTIQIRDESVLTKSEQQYHLIAVKSDDPSDFIEGMVFEISVEELLTADEYETEDYVRVNVKLESGLQSWVYVAR